MGTLLFFQLTGLILPFILLMPLVDAQFVESAAGSSREARLAVLLLFANGAITIGIAVAAFATISENGHAWALWLLAASVAWFAAQAADNTLLLSMVSLSERYADGGAASADLLGALGSELHSTRRWAHYTELLIVEAWFVVFYGALLRFALIPRVLAGFGIAMVVVHAASVTLPVFLDYPGTPAVGASLAFSHVAVGGWLIAKGFRAAPARSGGKS